MVNWLLAYFNATESAEKRSQAVLLGQRLMDQGLFAHVVEEAKPFEDDFVFYRFAAPGSDAIYGCAADIGGEDVEVTDEQLQELVPRMFSGEPGAVSVEDRRWRLKKFSKCFIASEVVDWLCVNLHCTRAKAVSIGERMQEAELIEHVALAHEFKDEYLFFRLCEIKVEDHALSDFTARTIDGEEVSMGQFLGRVIIIANGASF